MSGVKHVKSTSRTALRLQLQRAELEEQKRREQQQQQQSYSSGVPTSSQFMSTGKQLPTEVPSQILKVGRHCCTTAQLSASVARFRNSITQCVGLRLGANPPTTSDEVLHPANAEATNRVVRHGRDEGWSGLRWLCVAADDYDSSCRLAATGLRPAVELADESAAAEQCPRSRRSRPRQPALSRLQHQPRNQRLRGKRSPSAPAA